MVNSNEPIKPEAQNIIRARSKANKRVSLLPPSGLSEQVSLISNENLKTSLQGYKPSPRITPRTSHPGHLSLPSHLESKAGIKGDEGIFSSFDISQRPKASPSEIQAHLSLPLLLSGALPKSIQTWGDRSKPIDSCNSLHIKRCFKNLQIASDHMWGQSVMRKNVIEFIDELLFLNDYYPSVAPVNLNMNLPKTITELTYLVYNKPTLVGAILDKNHIPESVEKINYYFTHSLKRVHRQIDEAYKVQLGKGISSAKKAKHIAIPIAISRTLIPPAGPMLEDLIPSIISEFVNEDNPYSHSLKAGLKLLYQSADLKSTIEETRLPEDHFSNSALLIRATLNLSKKAELHDFHAKRTALSAFLTHMRQGQNGSCFASFFAIELQSINPHGALLDFKQLLREGKLLRKIDNQIHDFPYLMKTEIPQLSAEWIVSGSGKIHSDPPSYLWDLPGIQSICDYLEVPCQEYILTFLKSFCPEGKTVELTLDHLLDDLSIKYSCEREYLAVIFTSSTHHPLLSIWGNSIAGMAEGLSGSMLKSALIQSIHYLVKKAAKTNGYLDLLNQYEILPKIEYAVMQRSHYLYDPTLTLKNILKGAFVLYDSHDSKDFKNWTKTGNAPDFLNYLTNLIESVWLELDNNAVDHLKQAILKELSEEDFICLLLKRYHRENQNISPDKISTNYLRYTPWISSIGNDPQMVLKVYHETENTYSIKQITPASAEELLNLIQQTIQSLPYDRKKKYLSHGDYILPLRIKGVHVFSLLVCHPSMQPFLTSSEKKQYPSDLIKSLSKITISSQIKNLITEYCYSFVEPNHYKTIDEKLSSLQKKYSPQQLKDFLITTLKDYKPVLYRDEELIREIELKILEFLPKNVRTEWENSIVHFADTNWQTDIQDIHYGIGINPCTGKTELMSVLGNGKIYKFLDQNQFLNGKVWELYLDL